MDASCVEQKANQICHAGACRTALYIDGAGNRPHLISVEMSGHPRITVDPAVCGGRPVVKCTRMRVTDVLETLAAGASVDEIVADLPYITKADVRAALAFAARFTPRA